MLRQLSAGANIAAELRAAVMTSEPVHVPTSGGAALDRGLRATAEARLGHDLGDVRVHQDSLAERAAAAVGANALTRGPHIALSARANARDERLMMHEVTHVVQQREGHTAGLDALGGHPWRRAALESEAHAVARGQKRVPSPPTASSSTAIQADVADDLLEETRHGYRADARAELAAQRARVRAISARARPDEANALLAILQQPGHPLTLALRRRFDAHWVADIVHILRERAASQPAPAPVAAAPAVDPWAPQPMAEAEIRRHLASVSGWIDAHGIDASRRLALVDVRDRLQAALALPMNAGDSEILRRDIARALPPAPRPELIPGMNAAVESWAREDAEHRDGGSGGEAPLPIPHPEGPNRALENYLRAESEDPDSPAARHRREVAEQAQRARDREETARRSAAVRVPAPIQARAEVGRAGANTLRNLPIVSLAVAGYESVTGRDVVEDTALDDNQIRDRLLDGVEGVLLLVPYVGEAIALTEAIDGRTLLTQHHLSTLERVLNVALVIVPFVPAIARGASRGARAFTAGAARRLGVPRSQVGTMLQALERVAQNQAPIREALAGLREGRPLSAAQQDVLQMLEIVPTGTPRAAARAPAASPRAARQPRRAGMGPALRLIARLLPDVDRGMPAAVTGRAEVSVVTREALPWEREATREGTARTPTPEQTPRVESEGGVEPHDMPTEQAEAQADHVEPPPAPAPAPAPVPAPSATVSRSERRRRQRWLAENQVRAQLGLAPLPWRTLADIEQEVASGGTFGTHADRHRAGYERRWAGRTPTRPHHPQNPRSPVLVPYREILPNSYGGCVTHAVILALRFSGRTGATLSDAPFISDAAGRTNVQNLRAQLRRYHRGTINDAMAAAMQRGPGTQVMIAAQRNGNPHVILARVNSAGQFELWDTWRNADAHAVPPEQSRFYNPRRQAELAPNNAVPEPNYIYSHPIEMTEITDPDTEYTILGYRVLPF